MVLMCPASNAGDCAAAASTDAQCPLRWARGTRRALQPYDPVPPGVSFFKKLSLGEGDDGGESIDKLKFEATLRAQSMGTPRRIREAPAPARACTVYITPLSSRY